MQTFFINGKFTAQRITGVQRVAHQLLQALDQVLAEAPSARRWVLLHPPGGELPSLHHLESRCIGAAGSPLHLWEQTVLPWHARAGRLLNLAGSSPLWPQGQICTLHDAAVFDQPQAYTPAFVAWYRWLFRRQARQAARLLTVSMFSRERLALGLGVAPSGIEVVPNGGDHLLATTTDEGVIDRHALRDCRCLLAVGSHNPTKNLARLAQAFISLRPPSDVRLVLVTGRNDRVFAAADDWAAHPQIVLTGPLTDAPLKALYCHALALVFPSLYEGFGLPPLEAMSCGCPVAAARAASIPEVCGDAVLYFEPTETAQIAQAMQRLLDDAGLRAALVQAGAQRVRKFTWKAAATRLRVSMEGLA